MLSREQAERRLKEFHVKNWKKSRVEELGALPIATRTTGRAFLEADPEGKPFRNWEKKYMATEQAREDLGAMKDADRRRLFAALFPRLADALEAGWRLFARLPYETDGCRKAFRAPGDDEAKKSARVE